MERVSCSCSKSSLLLCGMLKTSAEDDDFAISLKSSPPRSRAYACRLTSLTESNASKEELSKLLHASCPCPARLEYRLQQLHNTQSIISVASDGFHLGNPCPIHTKHSFESSSKYKHIHIASMYTPKEVSL